MTCPDCGAEMEIPEKPGPITSCDCGWYRVGAMVEPETGTSVIEP